MNICITGVTRGIGRSLALELAHKEHQLILVARDRSLLDELAQECNARAGLQVARTVEFDLSDADGTESVLPMYIRSITHQIDVLVNNAGTLINKPFEQFTNSEARRIFEVNFFSLGAMIRGLLPLLRNAHEPHIVNISSMGGIQGSIKFSGLSYYSASKGAVAVLTEALAEELAESGIRINAIAPGAVQTDMLASAFPGFKAPVTAGEMAKFLRWFVLEGYRYFNGKILPVSVSVP
ncbi:MAG: SDR family NAD(P)-dependent oxidoreductase [Bacteroidota bacterium]